MSNTCTNNWTKGYKAFDRVEGNDKAGTCLDYLYEEGKEYHTEGELGLCKNGFHACKDLVLTFQYYGSDLNKYTFAEIEFTGECQYEEPTKHKGCSSSIKIQRCLSKEEVQEVLEGDWNSGYGNSGDGNSGNWNSGNWNSGNWNSGDNNSGYRNSGNWNSGDNNSGNWNSGDNNSGDGNSGYRNSGNWNSGDRNSGYGNSGGWNSGDRNSGNWNSGNWNAGSYSSGCFNTTTEEYIRVFNKPCRRSVWESAEKPDFLFFSLEEGKTYKESFQESFKKADKDQIELLKALPNFDTDVFFAISGIQIED